MSSLKNIVCPHCGKKATWQLGNKHRPFCSERCQSIDFGAWAKEIYRVPSEPTDPKQLPRDDADKS
jgi:endogenous inhibitor of DNA gyrase (YacG/DUF329 family)